MEEPTGRLVGKRRLPRKEGQEGGRCRRAGALASAKAKRAGHVVSYCRTVEPLIWPAGEACGCHRQQPWQTAPRCSARSLGLRPAFQLCRSSPRCQSTRRRGGVLFTNWCGCSSTPLPPWLSRVALCSCSRRTAPCTMRCAAAGRLAATRRAATGRSARRRVWHGPPPSCRAATSSSPLAGMMAR